ncbi:MAG: magnesium transporter CorA family protein [Bacillota bacterium]
MKQSIKHDSNLLNRDWLNGVKINKTNSIEIEIIDDHYILKGSLVYDQNFSDERDYKIFHFYLTSDTFITVDLDFCIFQKSQTEKILRQISKTKQPIDGFLLILRELLTKYLVSIDDFEGELRKLIWCIHRKNKTSILENIYERRHELLVWSNILIPMNELIMAIEEVYLDEVSDNKTFVRTEKRINRALYLIHEYEHEVDSIINLEEVISSHRGNEIMKTLTVMTAIFTPVMAWGALWGMNFKVMPELEWKYGYLISLLLISISMVAVYIYLKMKGWTGDLLKGKKKGSFFK